MEEKQEGLLKYMAHLPSYLERGESRDEKLLNVGVLDWRRLQKWQSSQKPTFQRSRRSSESSVNSSSSCSAEGSSLHSSGGESSSPARIRARRPSLQVHLMSSTVHDTQVNNSFEECNVKLLSPTVTETNVLNGRSTSIDTKKPFLSDHGERKSEQCNLKGVDTKFSAGDKIAHGRVKYEAFSYMKEKSKAKDGAFPNTVGKLQDCNIHNPDKDEIPKSEGVLLTLRDLCKDHEIEILQLTKTARIIPPGPKDASQISSSNVSKGFSATAINSLVPRSRALLIETDKCSNIRRCSKDEMSAILPDSTHRVQCQDRRGVGLHNRSSKRYNLTKMSKSVNCNEASLGSKPRLNKANTEKGRSTSPFRQLGIGIRRIGKSLSSNDSLSKPQWGLTQDLTNPTSVTANCPPRDISNIKTLEATRGSSSSPLRRLLDPLLKPKAANCSHSGELADKNSTNVNRASKSSVKELASLSGTVQLRELESDSTGYVDVNDLTHQKKKKSQVFQAVLRYSHKNGQPMFTFAIENECDILAATMKKLNDSREDEYSCVYTFFSISELKKKNGKWIIQAGKGKAQDYTSNVVAQLNVSGSQCLDFNEKGYKENSFAMEFVLFDINLQVAERQSNDVQPKNELAAIIVNIPQKINRAAFTDNRHMNKPYTTPEAITGSNSREHALLPFVDSQNSVSMTVILPSGLHSLPSKGGPSTLLQRWRSGGSCDCGGWDLACNLRVLTNQNQHYNCPSSTTDRIELISHEGEKKQFINMIPYKDGIYSVEFDSSLSTLQAFSVCIAVLDGRKFTTVAELNSSFRENATL